MRCKQDKIVEPVASIQELWRTTIPDTLLDSHDGNKYWIVKISNQ